MSLGQRGSPAGYAGPLGASALPAVQQGGGRLHQPRLGQDPGLDGMELGDDPPAPPAISQAAAGTSWRARARDRAAAAWSRLGTPRAGSGRARGACPTAGATTPGRPHDGTGVAVSAATGNEPADLQFFHRFACRRHTLSRARITRWRCPLRPSTHASITDGPENHARVTGDRQSFSSLLGILLKDHVRRSRISEKIVIVAAIPIGVGFSGKVRHVFYHFIAIFI